MRQPLRTIIASVALALPVAAVVPLAAQRPATTTQQGDWVDRLAIYEVNIRDFSSTGDLRGVMRGLDRIQATGTNVLWLMPIYPVGVLHHKGTLGSQYSVRDYHAINPAFGTPADLRALVRAVHARGMKLILDWVPNHTSWDNVWVQEHPGFYVRNDSGGLTVPRDDKGNPTDWTDVAQLDYGNPALRRAMIDAMTYWLRTFDIDGFRVDAAGFVPDTFWQQAVPALRAAVPRRILLLAEWGDVKMNRFGFDLTYAWDSYARLKAVWKGGSAGGFAPAEVADEHTMPVGGARMRFTTNHDETAWDHPPITLFGGAAGARAAFVAEALLPGRPLLYDGQEVESPQQLGLFEREPIQWNQPGADAARSFYRRVIDLARSDPSFVGRTIETVATDDTADVIAYRRGSAVVLVNPRDHAVHVTPLATNIDGTVDRLSNRTQHGNTIALPARTAVVLEPATRSP